MNISKMQAELGKLGNLHRAIEGAKEIADALANAEQVGRELDDANAAKRAEIETYSALRLDAEDATEKAKAKAREIAKSVETKIARMREKADIEIAQQHNKAVEVLTEVANQAEAAKAELGSLSQTIEAKKVELGELEARLAEAHAAARKFMESGDG